MYRYFIISLSFVFGFSAKSQTILSDFDIDSVQELSIFDLEAICDEYEVPLESLLFKSIIIESDLRKKLNKIKLLILDVDGVMTDGGMLFTANGDEQKKFKDFAEYGGGISKKDLEALAEVDVLSRGAPTEVDTEIEEKIKTLQTDKDEKIVCLYTSNEEEQYSFVKKAKDRGYDVLHLAGPLMSHWLQKLESTFENVTFTRVDSDSLDKLIKKSEDIPSKLSKEDEEKLKPVFEDTLNKEKFMVQFESMSEDEAPIIVTQPEFMRRMMEQQRMGGGGMYGAFPEMHHVVVNANHPKVGALLEKDGDDQKVMVKQLTDLALLGQGLLKGEALNSFIERNMEQIA